MSADIISFPERQAYADKLDEPVILEIEANYHIVGKHWMCSCGNLFFQVGPDGVLCPRCGTWANFA